jgi:hypothetical protein
MAKNSWGNYTQSELINVSGSGARVFVSYYTPIAIVNDDYILVVDQKFSRTTSKQTTQFLRHMGNLNIAYVSPDRFKEALKTIGWIYGTGWVQ